MREVEWMGFVGGAGGRCNRIVRIDCYAMKARQGPGLFAGRESFCNYALRQ